MAPALRDMIAEKQNQYRTMNEISIITVNNKHDGTRVEAWSNHEAATERARYLAFHAITEGDELGIEEDDDGVTTYCWDDLAHEEHIAHRKVTINGDPLPAQATEHSMVQLWGERCDDHEPGCPTCEAWACWDSKPGTIPGPAQVEAAIEANLCDHIDHILDEDEEQEDSDALRAAAQTGEGVSG